MSRPLDPALFRAAPQLRVAVIGLGLLAGLSSIAAIGQAVALARIVAAVVSGRTGSLTEPLLELAAWLAVRAAGNGIQEWWTARCSLGVRAALRSALVQAVVRAGPGWVRRQPAGRLATATGPGLEALDGYLTRALPALVATLVIPPMVLGRIALADWRSAAILVLTLPLLPLFMALVGLSTGQRMAGQYAALSGLAGHFLDLVRGLTTLKIYGAAERQRHTVRRATEAYRRRTMAILRTAFLSGLVLDLVATLSVAVVAVDVGLRLDAGHLSLTTALVVLLLAPELYAPLRTVGAQYHASEDGRQAAAAMLAILAEAPAAEPSGDLPLLQGEIRFEGVSLTWPGRPVPALDRIDLDLQAGRVLAVSGASGAGKSSLLGLILGLVEPTAGAIQARTSTGWVELDASARASLAWVPQRPRPTQATVAAEVRLGHPSATAAQVAQAIRDCAAPKATIALGEDGARLSAGQRRRVALARAVLRARAVAAAGGIPIVLLDEPSEDLDPATEQLVVRVVRSLAGWATVVLVSHSETLRAAADREIVLADGRIVSDRPQWPVRPDQLELGATARPADNSTKSVRTPSIWPLFGGPGRIIRLLARAVLAGGAGGVAGLALTATSIWLLCRASQHPNVQALEVAVVGVRTFALARALLRYAERLSGHDLALRLLTDVRGRVFDALVAGARPGWRRGELLRRFVTDVDGVQDAVVRTAVPVIGATITGAAAVGLAAALVPAAGLVLAGGLLATAFGFGLSTRAASSGTALAAAAGRRDQQVTGLLDGLDELAVYGADRPALARIAAADAEVSRLARRPRRAGALGLTGVGLVGALTLPATLAVTAASAQSPLAIGVILACGLIAFEAVAPLPVALAAWSLVRAGLSRVAEVINLAPPLEPADCDLRTTGLDLHGHELAIAPSGADQPVIHGVNLDVIAGRRLAVIGPSGGGKSTLLAALVGQLPPRRGRIMLSDRVQQADLDQLSTSDRVPRVAGSLQGDHVFAVSLADNVKLACPAATEAELDQVAERVGLRPFLAGRPEGWASAAGPDGANLSGGERQRLLLARALLADPDILVLDEPTAHLDRDTEQLVLADLFSATAGRTLVVSSHRQLPAGRVDGRLSVEHGSAIQCSYSDSAQPAGADRC